VIRFLSVHRLAVIDQLEIELGPGMSVLTGETGAGKSILVEAVGLLLGERASADLVRSGEETAIVQAILDTPSGAELIVRREVSVQGRSRAFLDGQLVTTAALRDAVGTLIDLHGQHEHQALLDPATQLALLDRYAGLDGERAATAAAHARFVESRDALARFDTLRRTRAERLDMLEFQAHEIEKVAPRAGEDGALEAERTVAANAEKLARLAGEAYGALYDDDHAAMAALATVWKRLGELAALDPRFQPILETRASVMAPLDDAARTLRDYAGSIDRSPERLQAIEDRLAALTRLKRRYGPTLDEVLAKAREIADELASLAAGDDTRAALADEAGDARRTYVAAADALAAARRTAAPRLARALEAALGELAMGGTRCQLALSAIEPEGEWGPAGRDRLELLLSPNVGEDLRPLARIASGGELSRVMLAMKSLASTDVPGKTLIFDLRRGGRRHRRGGRRRRRRPAPRAVDRLPGALHHAPPAGRRVRRRALPGVEDGGRRPHGDPGRAARRGRPGARGRSYDGRAGGVRRGARRGSRPARRPGQAKGESGPEGERRKSPDSGRKVAERRWQNRRAPTSSRPTGAR
jgi:DNA repair protein RecN (Recombination protein N)